MEIISCVCLKERKGIIVNSITDESRVLLWDDSPFLMLNESRKKKEVTFDQKWRWRILRTSLELLSRWENSLIFPFSKFDPRSQRNASHLAFLALFSSKRESLSLCIWLCIQLLYSLTLFASRIRVILFFHLCVAFLESQSCIPFRRSRYFL
jgi:hypothetical protein